MVGHAVSPAAVADAPVVLAAIPGLVAYIDPRGRPDGAYSPLTDELGNALNAGRTPPPVTSEQFVSNGSSHRFEYATVTGATFASIAFSIGVRCNPSTTSEETAGTAGGTPRLFLKSGGASSYDGASNISFTGSTGWQTLVYIHDGTDFFIRRDGVEVARITIAPAAIPANAFHFGWNVPAGFLGNIGAAVAITRALAGAELVGLEAALTASAA